jgi:drug/metabolite transporter (DMT)-like permease
MNKKLTIQFFAGILFLVAGLVALVRGIIEPSERSTLAGIAMLIAAAFLLYGEDNNRRELMPIRVRARNQ